MDWDAITRGWVEDGLIAESQRGPLLERLRTLPQPAGLGAGPIITLLVAVATWLLVGSCTALTVTLLEPPWWLWSGGFGVVAAALGALGVAMRMVPTVLPVGRGLMAASVPLAALSLGFAAEEGPDWMMGAMLIPALIGSAVAVLEGSRALAATASLTVTLATWTWLASLRVPLRWDAAVFVALGAVVVLAVASRLLAVRATALQVQAPAWVLLAATSLIGTETHLAWLWGAIRLDDAWAVEKSLELLAVGVVVIGAGLVARGAFTLIPAVLCLSTAAVTLAFAIGDWIGGAIALGLVSAALFAGALAMWVVPAMVRGREAPPSLPTPSTV